MMCLVGGEVSTRAWSAAGGDPALTAEGVDGTKVRFPAGRRRFPDLGGPTWAHSRAARTPSSSALASTGSARAGTSRSSARGADGERDAVW